MRKIYFFFTVLRVFNCDKQTENNVPVITHQNKEHQPTAIQIVSTGARAVVCIGSNNTMHIRKISKRFLVKQAISSLRNIDPHDKSSILNHRHKTIPIKITGTKADATVVFGSSNAIYRHIEKEKKKKDKIREKPPKKNKKIDNSTQRINREDPLVSQIAN